MDAVNNEANSQSHPQSSNTIHQSNDMTNNSENGSSLFDIDPHTLKDEIIDELVLKANQCLEKNNTEDAVLILEELMKAV